MTSEMCVALYTNWWENKSTESWHVRHGNPQNLSQTQNQPTTNADKVSDIQWENRPQPSRMLHSFMLDASVSKTSMKHMGMDLLLKRMLGGVCGLWRPRCQSRGWSAMGLCPYQLQPSAPQSHTDHIQRQKHASGGQRCSLFTKCSLTRNPLSETLLQLVTLNERNHCRPAPGRPIANRCELTLRLL